MDDLFAATHPALLPGRHERRGAGHTRRARRRAPSRRSRTSSRPTRSWHREDVEGFHEALQEIDAAVAGWLERLRPGDLLVITADHGVDPKMAHADHTRERVPLSRPRFAGDSSRRHDGPMADVGTSALADRHGQPFLPGDPFV